MNLTREKINASYEELLDVFEVQVVYILLENSMHREWTGKATHKRKHKLCEKPIALDTEECMEMIAKCKKNNRNWD